MLTAEDSLLITTASTPASDLTLPSLTSRQASARRMLALKALSPRISLVETSWGSFLISMESTSPPLSRVT